MKTMMRGNREGMALMLVIIVVMVGATIAAGAAVIGANSWLMTQYEERQSLMQAAADAGLEEGRARLNGDRTLYPTTGFVTLENNIQVTDGAGTAMRNIRRTSYAGPIGVTTGQYGVFGSVVSVVQDANGDQVIRRAEIVQESFAKFAYFTNDEGTVSFGSGDALYGPVHSNDDININSAAPLPFGATFYGPVTTSGTITNSVNGDFKVGYLNSQPIIPMPTTTALNTVQSQAAPAGMAFISTNNGAAGEATMRLFFVALDLNGDGDRTDPDEGFVRVYTNTNYRFVSATVASGTSWRSTRNCGHADGHSGTFRDAAWHGTSGSDRWNYMLESGTARCYLGGDERIWSGAFTGGAPNTDAMGGQWLRYAGVPDPRIAGVAGRSDGQWLFPLNRQGNPNFRGVIHVDGKVVISGELRGRITLAATGNIIVGDDMRYSVNAGVGVCTDILGLFSGTDVVISNNGINAPNKPDGTTGTGTYYTWDDTSDEFLDAVVLALGRFTVEDYNSGATNTEACGTTPKGRGCLFLTGGVIQTVRGAVGLASGEGNLKRYSYDACAGSDPPPYFPTTGRFAKTRTFEVDPTGFNITTYFATITAR